jgi:hypothetical protein
MPLRDCLKSDVVPASLQLRRALRRQGVEDYWIRYTDAAGRPHREQGGKLGNAIKLLATRHSEKLEGKLPEKKIAKKTVMFTDLIDDAIS